MQPGATELLNGIKGIIFNTLMPELQTEQARQQALYSCILLDHLSARWEIEVPQLQEEHAELRALLIQAVAVTDDARVRDALDGAGEATTAPGALAAANERMRRLIPALSRELPAEHRAAVLELDAAIRAYIRNQHRRDQAVVQIGGLAW